MAEWRTCVENDNYEVSDEGQVRRARGGQGTYAGRVLRLKPSNKRHWYYRIALSAGGVETDYSVHTLVCHAFQGEPPTPEHEVAHGDGNPHNNRASNLRWSTPVENHADKVRHGTLLRGERCYNSKLTDSDVASIRRWAPTGISQKELAKGFRVQQSHISAIVRGAKRRTFLPQVQANG